MPEPQVGQPMRKLWGVLMWGRLLTCAAVGYRRRSAACARVTLPICPTRSQPVCTKVILGFVVMFQSYDYFSSSVSFFEIPYSLGDFSQRITPVDDRRYLSGFN